MNEGTRETEKPIKSAAFFTTSPKMSSAQRGMGVNSPKSRIAEITGRNLIDRLLISRSFYEEVSCLFRWVNNHNLAPSNAEGSCPTPFPIPPNDPPALPPV